MLTADLTAALVALESQRPRPTVTDLFRLAREHGVSAAFLFQAWENRGARPADQVRSDEADYREPCQACGDADPVPGEDHCQACLNVIYGPLIDDDGPDDDGGPMAA